MSAGQRTGARQSSNDQASYLFNGQKYSPPGTQKRLSDILRAIRIDLIKRGNATDPSGADLANAGFTYNGKEYALYPEDRALARQTDEPIHYVYEGTSYTLPSYKSAPAALAGIRRDIKNRQIAKRAHVGDMFTYAGQKHAVVQPTREQARRAANVRPNAQPAQATPEPGDVVNWKQLTNLLQRWHRIKEGAKSKEGEDSSSDRRELYDAWRQTGSMFNIRVKKVPAKLPRTELIRKIWAALNVGDLGRRLPPAIKEAVMLLVRKVTHMLETRNREQCQCHGLT